jgi:Spy/CpxP family protein refolding chaperone
VENKKMRGTWMKNTVLLLGMSLAGTALLAQQTSPEAAPPATSQAVTQGSSATSGALQLTVEQKKQLRELRLSAHDQAAIIRHDQSLSDDQKTAKLEALRASTREQMKAVLTPAQQAAFAERRAAHQAKFAAKLGLTPDQQSKLKELFASNRQQREAVLTNASLTNEQKQAQLSGIRATNKAQLATILTPEQLAQFEQMRQARRHSHMGMRGQS